MKYLYPQMHSLRYILGAAVGLVMTVSGAFAGGNTQYPLPALPAVITTPGTYKAPTANATLTYTGPGNQAAITIACDGVVLNLNGCTIVVPNGQAVAGIFVNVDDYKVNPSGINSGIVIKNGLVQTSGCDGIRVSGSLASSGMNGAVGFANGVQIDHVTVLTTGYVVDAIKDGGNNTRITNCILATAVPVVLPAPQFWQVPGFGVDCFRGQGEVVSGNNFVLCFPGYSYRTIYPTGNLFDSTNNTDPLDGVTGDGSVNNPWINVPKGGVN